MNDTINIPPVFKVEKDIVDYSSSLDSDDLDKWAVVNDDGTLKLFETREDADDFVESIFDFR